MRKINILLFTLLNLCLINKTIISQVTYNYTGAVQTYVVPPNIDSLLIDMAGASAGNSVGLAVINNPGLGGRVLTKIDVTPGDILNLYVGQKGSDGSMTVIVPGGWNGGGNSGVDTSTNLYGGGAGGGVRSLS